MFTIGHSTHDSSTFLRLLQRNRVTAIADVRSVPMSRHNPQFNKQAIEGTLDAAGIRYVFLGTQLGARTNDPACYVDGQVQYQRLSHTSEFRNGIELLLRGIKVHRIAIMCSEAEPLDCHRTVLISQVLIHHGLTIEHIHRDGRTESHAMAMHRLMIRFGLHQADLFRSPAELLQEALTRQEQRIAYVQPEFGAEVAADR
ncbi:hypothetical protein AWC27_02260 [Mycobacterium szulgai]|uniref:DUF488 domain-containing protein n=1 Tax=Mycobacterium szulgai TaxID=1787 RepID=A0A1X2EEW1_MYCSZ|nr:DUF488 domain-containing protein [Mycobacterium szulgai]ORW99666.1 hypothetical protein AWC27_02260 [Mycobacterium szulgai]